MPLQELLAFFIFAITAAITPGPSNVLVMTAGARSGFLGGLKCLLGVVAGMAAMMGAAVAGLGGVITAFPLLLVALKWIGSAFLLWLAWKVANAPPMRSQLGAEAIGFWKSLTFQWINPKSWIVSASSAASYGSSLPGSVGVRALAIAGTFALAATIACTVWLVFGAALKQWLGDERNSRVFNRSMGVLLAATVVLIHL
jgi:threonine/homoserine/homoserine lactone efflux protein